MEVIMMKKLMVALMCIGLLSGCANNDDDKTNSNSRSTQNQNDVVDNNAAEDGNAISREPITDGNWFGQFESGLQEGNINYSSKSSLDASTIGGAEGYRYVTENGNIDVYRFEDGEEFDKITKDKKINFGENDSRNVIVNDHMVIVSDDVSQDVLDIFKGLK